jgi:hypothetical protein
MKPNSEIRNPKPEIRSSGWVSHKVVSTRSGRVARRFAQGITPAYPEPRDVPFGIRISGFFRHAGIRNSDFLSLR